MLSAITRYPRFCKPVGYDLKIGGTVFTDNERCVRELSAFLANVMAETIPYHKKEDFGTDAEWEVNNALLEVQNSTCSASATSSDTSKSTNSR
jgi:hypothetical protein